MRLKNAEGQYLYHVALTPPYHTVETCDQVTAPDWPSDVAENIICLLADLGYIFTGEEEDSQ